MATREKKTIKKRARPLMGSSGASTAWQRENDSPWAPGTPKFSQDLPVPGGFSPTCTLPGSHRPRVWLPHAVGPGSSQGLQPRELRAQQGLMDVSAVGFLEGRWHPRGSNLHGLPAHAWHDRRGADRHSPWHPRQTETGCEAGCVAQRREQPSVGGTGHGHPQSGSVVRRCGFCSANITTLGVPSNPWGSPQIPGGPTLPCVRPMAPTHIPAASGCPPLADTPLCRASPPPASAPPSAGKASAKWCRGCLEAEQKRVPRRRRRIWLWPGDSSAAGCYHRGQRRRLSLPKGGKLTSAGQGLPRAGSCVPAQGPRPTGAFKLLKLKNDSPERELVGLETARPPEGNVLASASRGPTSFAPRSC